MEQSTIQSSVLPNKYGGGPHGLGDPADLTLRKVELEVMIPKKMRDIAKIEKCHEEVKQFSDCCRENTLLMAFTCRGENTGLKNCLSHWYNDEGFKDYCKRKYLEERSEYRRTGITSGKKSRLPTSM